VTDSSDIVNLLFTTSMASVSPNATLPVEVTINYNVVAVSGSITTPGARVILRLRRVNIATNITETIATHDSNNYPPSASFERRSEAFCALHFDFLNNAYYVQAELRKNTPASLRLRLFRLAQA
jgi:hypothetical protein